MRNKQISKNILPNEPTLSEKEGFLSKLVHNIRFYVLLLSGLFSGGVYIWALLTFPDRPNIQIIRLTQFYSLTSVTYLYLALLAGPLTYTFRFLPFRQHYLKARRALGVSAFYFGLLHGSIAFFGQLGGFAGLAYLSSNYLIAISLSFTALVILSAMAITSFDFVIAKMKFKRWKMLHRFVYLGSVFILIHALMLGTHFRDLSATIPQIMFIAVFFLLILEGLRFDYFIQNKFSTLPKFGLTYVLISVFFGAALYYIFIPPGAIPDFGIHSAHIQLAKDIQTGTVSNLPGNTPKIPGLDGDRTKRYSVDLKWPDKILPNQETEFNFNVYDASSGNKVFLFKKIYGKVVHMIIVDSELKYFTHIHPEQTANGFTIKTQLPKEGRYHIYLDFQPFGAIEQQIAHTVFVGDVEKPALSTATPDTNLTKTFGDYEVTLKYPTPLKSAEISVGQQVFTYTIKDAKTKQGITNLKPYLEAFGHLVMINQQTFDYVHVHPRDLTVPPPDSNGGPTVEFMPIGIYGAIKPGIYRVFGQFNPDNKLFTSDFTVEIK
jgi:DMSO/TMAO reductase YedYZ heme-binding membrane subunit